MGTDVTGGCQCGAVRFSLAERPAAPGVCHCRMCQKAGGAPFMVFAGLPKAQVTWTRGRPTFFASSDFAERGFCAACGTPLTYGRIGGDRISFTSGSFDDPTVIVPTEEFAVESRLSWLGLLGALPGQTFEDWRAQQGAAIHSHQHPDHD